MNITERLAEQRARLAQAARSVGRDPAAIKLIAVSKRHSLDAIRQAYAAGQRDFGENYVQELAEKAEQLRDLPDIAWHMIGHLQSNKARLVAPLAFAVHTVSSLSLAAELGKRARARVADAHRQVPSAPIITLVEVNVSGESSKSGCTPAELPRVLQAIEAEEGLKLAGLMTMPPFDDDAERARPYFEQLCALREQYGGQARLPELSMGMSHDMPVAVACGATMVRIGTAIFGERS
ncbi:MAG TPA: YggS family pyridoxal phosphate-dependent enzyme [Polyangiaceae bacterium]|nr:YggS family pyridoxal phosphate-dependent enzyme [Polyangiaceae bacterium]